MKFHSPADVKLLNEGVNRYLAFRYSARLIRKTKEDTRAKIIAIIFFGLVTHQ